jgi:murein DD-endopeptidase MepM/ murein hydrolase activator NlpD
MRRSALVLATFFALTGQADAAWTWPVSGDVITPYRNGTDPYATGQHRGIDIAAPVGAPVVAAAGGEVRFAGTAGSSGLTVSVRTSDGYDTSYLHLSSLSVRAGAQVAAGDRLGDVGATGTRSAPAPHLHFGVRDAGSRHAYHDPLTFLPPQPTAPRPSSPPTPLAPAPAPLPPAPAPMPAAPEAHGAPRPAPHRAVRGRRVPAPRAAPGPRRSPRPVPHPTPTLRRAPLPRSPHLAPERGPTAHRTPPGRGHGRQAEPSAARAREPGPSSLPVDRSRAAEPGTGPDAGWALACAGLLLAAGVLGLGGRERGTEAGVFGKRLHGRSASDCT